ncbi:MAG: DUF2808 domain-containing protein [Alkalinema sp. RL_2_19]|nr:DUF2808 domain-containing protein [Alkalinema sp. RL_2_19]
MDERRTKKPKTGQKAIQRRTWGWIGSSIVAVSVGGIILSALPGRSLVVNGVSYFLAPPRFVAARTSQDGTYIWNATYDFVLALPENAGEDLQRVSITQRGGIGRPRFRAKDIRVFVSQDSAQLGEAVELSEVTIDDDQSAMTIDFATPIAPGAIVTVRLYPVRNPATAGTYLYEIMAFPVGEQPRAYNVGTGQIRIYDNTLD